MPRKIILASFAFATTWDGASGMEPFRENEEKPIKQTRSEEVLSRHNADISMYDSCQRRATMNEAYTAPVEPIRDNCYQEEGGETTTVGIFFARHAQSEWNKGGNTQLGKCLQALV